MSNGSHNGSTGNSRSGDEIGRHRHHGGRHHGHGGRRGGWGPGWYGPTIVEYPVYVEPPVSLPSDAQLEICQLVHRSRAGDLAAKKMIAQIIAAARGGDPRARLAAKYVMECP